MAQTVLALAALCCVVFVSLNVQRSGHRRALQTLKSEVEAHATSVGAQLLDRAGTLPFDGPAVGPGTPLERVPSLDQWDGRSGTAEVPAGQDTLRFQVRARVEPVVKNGGAFVPAPAAASAPFRKLTLSVEGRLSVSTTVERVYADLSR